MSDQWEFYPCQMGDNVAFVFVNVSVGERLAAAGRTGQVLLRIKLKHPRDDGLTTNQEFDSLSAVEDGFNNFCATADAEMVGRITVGGIRDFAIYATDAEQVAHGLRTIAEDEHGYEVECMVRDDPEFEVYWKHLYPSPVDLQLIHNRHLLEALEEHGDDRTQPRQIHHWLSFESVDHRGQFAARIAADGFAIEAQLEADQDSPRHGLQISREDTPEFEAINDLTVMLFRLAQEFEGEYEGWETQVVADEAEME